jgi:hypothetical protein
LQSYSLLSNQYINLTTGASDTRYTAPADGWFSFKAIVTNTNYCHVGLYNTSKIWAGPKCTAYNGTNNTLSVLAPVSRGDVISITYMPNTKEHSLVFIYAIGSAPQS